MVAPDDVSFFEASLPHAIPTAVLVLAVVAVPVMVLQPQGLRRMRALEAELAHVNEENAALEQDIATLRDEVKALREDPTEVERIARDQLGLVRRNEVIFQFRRPR